MKKAFTLIELMISIVLFSFLLLAMSNVIKEVKFSKEFLEKNYKTKDYVVKVLYYDILNSKSIKIIHLNPNYDRLILTTSNSLYNLINPTVIWYVSKHKNALLRIEGYNLKLPVNSSYIDKFKQNVTFFKLYKKDLKIFLYIKPVEEKALFFELTI